MKNLIKLKNKAYHNACMHGFHNDEKNVNKQIMLIVTEIGEAINADRLGNHDFKSENFKDTYEDELADIGIRLLDFAGLYEIDVPDEITNTFVNFTSNSVTNSVDLFRAFILLLDDLIDLTEDTNTDNWQHPFRILIAIAEYDSIDLEYYILQKMKYNEKREYLHGKKY